MYPQGVCHHHTPKGYQVKCEGQPVGFGDVDLRGTPDEDAGRRVLGGRPSAEPPSSIAEGQLWPSMPRIWAISACWLAMMAWASFFESALVPSRSSVLDMSTAPL